MTIPQNVQLTQAPPLGSETFQLEYPIHYAGATYETLTLRRPKIKDLKILAALGDKDPIGAQAKLLATLVIGNMDPKAIEELDLADSRKINGWVNSFTSGTGES